MRSVARHLIMDEGLLRFWKGAHVMASGCIPSHASYFLLYEKLKEWFRLENEEFEVTKSMAIGSMTTFMHDFFITPADGKFFLIHSSYSSREAETPTLQELNSGAMCSRHHSRRGLQGTIPVLLFDGWHECAVCELRRVHQREP